jgi:hypothetical protein
MNVVLLMLYALLLSQSWCYVLFYCSFLIRGVAAECDNVGFNGL